MAKPSRSMFRVFMPQVPTVLLPKVGGQDGVAPERQRSISGRAAPGTQKSCGHYPSYVGPAAALHE
eukprot:443914-Pyramimonas_sp.AAC.1